MKDMYSSFSEWFYNLGSKITIKGEEVTIDDLDLYEFILEKSVCEDTALDGINFEFVEQEGGVPGGGQNCYTVVKFGDLYFKIFYEYYSYEGFDLDNPEIRRVKPVERMVTFYECKH